MKKPPRVINLDHVIDSRSRQSLPPTREDVVEISEEEQQARLRAEQEEKEKQTKQEEARYIQ